MDDKEIFDNANIPTRLRKEFEIIRDAGKLFHISRIKPTNGYANIPCNVPRTYIDKENNTILRICVAKDVFNCLCGYHGSKVASAWSIYEQNFNIYAIECDVVLKPSKKIVADTNDGWEYWLVNYDGKHPTYKLRHIGTIYGVTGYHGNKELGADVSKLVGIAGIDIKETISFHNKEYAAGFYKLTIFAKIKQSDKLGDDKISVEKAKNIDEITKPLFGLEQVSDKAELLSLLQSDKPAFLR